MKTINKIVNKLASLATADNPCPLLELENLARVIRTSLNEGDTDEQAIEKGQAFIRGLK